MKKTLSLILVLTMLFLLVPGCGADDPGQSAPQQSGAAQTGTVSGSVLNIHANTDPGVLVPLVGKYPAFEFFWQMYDGLLKAEGGDYNNLQPGLAETYHISNDGLTYTFNLRKGVTFHNGDAFTAADVLCTLDRLAADANASAQLGVVSSYEAPDEYTVVLHLSEPSSALLPMFAFPCWGIVNHRLIEEHGNTEGAICGTGPYMLESYEVGTSVVLKAYEGYWGEAPRTETLNFKIITDANTAYVSFLSGELDCLRNVTTVQMESAEGNDDISVFTLQNPNVYSFWMNTSVAPFDDLRVRQAFSYLINKEDVSMAQFQGAGYTANQFWTEVMPGYVPENELNSINEYNVEKGLALLAEAGYEPKDLSFTILASTAQTAYTSAAENVQAQLMALGFDVGVEPYDQATFSSYAMAGEFVTMIYNGSAPSYNPISGFKTVFSAEAGWNCTRFNVSNPELQTRIDSMIREADATVDPAKRTELLEEITKLLCENVAGVPLSVGTRNFLFGSTVQGYAVNVDDGLIRWDKAIK